MSMTMRKKQLHKDMQCEFVLFSLRCFTLHVIFLYNNKILLSIIRKVDAYYYNLTNIATFNSQYGSPVVKKDGRLIGMCSSFEHHLTARNMVSIASSIERSHSRYSW